jgi:GTP-binding protein HflX
MQTDWSLFMKELLETKQELEQVILVGICTQENDDTEESLKELAELVETAGAHPLTMVIQNRESIHPGTYVGKGKIEELRELIDKLHATGIVCDDELSPAQFRNLEDALDTKVMDRTLIILDIFAAHASTKEGKIQVELAQLKYRSARLVGLRSSLSRLGGGIGTRGPGEKKLEMDRRLIKDRIAQLNKELQNVKQSREISRQQRSRNRMPIAAIVGYTNAGKSTLLNKLTDANVLEEDKLFATLDPTTRNLRLSSGQEILLTDTVGFIRKLPHHLIEAFRSTLEEAKYADIILHVVDTSNPQMNTQMQIVYETLKQLEIGNKPIITIFNKKDKLDSDSAPILRDFKADKILSISAKTGEGLNDLLTSLEEVLREQTIYLNYLFSYQDAGKIQSIRKNGQLLKEAYEEDGIRIEAYVPQELYAKITAQKA